MLKILNPLSFVQSCTFYGMDPVTATIGSAVLGGLFGMMNQPDTPTPAAVTPAPQAASAPDANTVRQSNTNGGAGAGGAGSGPASTLLTGPNGIDPNKLTLGSTLLTGS